MDTNTTATERSASALAALLALVRSNGPLPNDEALCLAATQDGIDATLPLEDSVTAITRIKNSRETQKKAILALVHLEVLRAELERRTAAAKSSPGPKQWTDKTDEEKQAFAAKITAWWTPERKAAHAKLMAEKAAAKKATVSQQSSVRSGTEA